MIIDACVMCGCLSTGLQNKKLLDLNCTMWIGLHIKVNKYFMLTVPFALRYNDC